MTGAGERERVVAWIRDGLGTEVVHMMLAAGLPGGTKTHRVKNRAFAAGCAHAVTVIVQAIERGDHMKGQPDD